MDLIDLRSDTVTRPTPAMRAAMAAAEVGDDVYGEDPTVNELERRAAQLTGKQAAVFVPSGTMGNTIALKVHTQPGQEIIAESRSHIMNYELAMAGWFCGCLVRTLSAPRGLLTWNAIEECIRPPSPHWAPTGLITVENTHNMGGGSVYALDQLAEIYQGAQERGLPVHMDGARVFNAAVALGVTVADITRYCDTVMFCLSKGLGAPVGSLVAGTEEQIEQARLYRKRLGGGMRQAGILAAAGLIALEEGPKQLVADHANARLLAEGLAEVPGVEIRRPVETNIVIVAVDGAGWTAPALSAALRKEAVLAQAVSPAELRLVTHRDVDRSACLEALERIRAVLSTRARARASTS
jgi:threonine aldolase